MSDLHRLPEPDRWRLYELEKQAWLDRHPEATYDEVQRAMREIANRCGV